MEGIPEKEKWFLSFFPVRSDPNLPYFEIKIKRLGLRQWSAEVMCIGTEFRCPFNLRLLGRIKSIELRADMWIEKQQSELEINLQQEAAANSPEPSGRAVDDAFWIAIASTRSPIIGALGSFKGRVVFSKKRPNIFWLIRRMIAVFWRTALAIIVWLVLAIIGARLMFSTSQGGGDHPIVHSI